MVERASKPRAPKLSTLGRKGLKWEELKSHPSPTPNKMDAQTKQQVRQSAVELQHLPEEEQQIPAARTQPITPDDWGQVLTGWAFSNPNNVSDAQTHREEYEHNHCATACRKLSGLRLHEQQHPQLRRNGQAWFLRTEENRLVRWRQRGDLFRIRGFIQDSIELRSCCLFKEDFELTGGQSSLKPLKEQKRNYLEF